MNGGNYRTEHREVDFDETEFLEKVLELGSRQKEKYALFKLLCEWSHDEAEVLKSLGETHAKLAEQMPRVFERILERHERACRLRKLTHLWRIPELEEEAIRKAARDTRRVMQAMSPVANETIQALLLNRGQVTRQLSGTMIDLMLGEGAAPNLEGVRRFLEGKTG